MRTRSTTTGPAKCTGTLAVLALVLSGSGCGEKTDPDSSLDPTVLLRIGDEVIERAEFDGLFDYIRRTEPSLGHKTIRRQLLEEHFLPMLLSRRDHPDLRAEQKRSAEAMVRGLGTAVELAERTRLMDLEARDYSWSDIPWPLREWTFDPLNLGGLAPVTEVLYGYVVLAPDDLTPGPTQQYSRIHAHLIPFPILPREEFRAWLDSARESLKPEDVQVHPDLADCLPDWFPN